MKYVVFVGDGMADYPVSELGNKTPLEVARTPHMDALAREALMFGLARTIPEGFEPGSDVGNMSIMGYDPRRYFTGRAPIEAASLGIKLDPQDVAIRCNLVMLKEQSDQWIMEDYSAGHISTEEAQKIIEFLRPELENERFELYTGVSYRHLLIWRGGLPEIDGIRLTPPHSIPAQPIEPHMPQGNGSGVLLELMERGQAALKRRGGKANAIWLWGAGPKPDMPNLQQRFGLKGSVISAVDLVRGLGIYAGLKVIRVPGATGYVDTNYQGKAEAALRALQQGDDLVYVHVEAPDEVSHEGSVEKKIKAIEDFDCKIVGPLVEDLQQFGDYSILLMPDHPTPVSQRVHTADPVPFLIYRSKAMSLKSSSTCFSESYAKESGLFLSEGHHILGMLVRP